MIGIIKECNAALWRRKTGWIVWLWLLVSGSAQAQELEPRLYNNLPTGQNFLALAYSYSSGDVNVTPSIPLTNAELTIDGPILGYLRTLNLGGNSGAIGANQPYVCFDGSAELDGERVTAARCGLGDLSIRLSYNFIGAPALAISDFVKRKPEFALGTSVQVSVPTGDYDNTKLINIGANRWYIKPEIGMSIPWQKWSFEFTAGVRFFADNDDYLEGSTLSQDPLWNVQAHVIYDLSPRQWLSVNGNYFFGGETSRDGVSLATQQENSRLGLTWSMALTPNHLLKLLAHKGVVTRIGNDSDTITLAYSYRWE